jgi:polyisoprenyl-teichoic acid--peptidoglycan teichoic acid transferase
VNPTKIVPNASIKEYQKEQSESPNMLPPLDAVVIHNAALRRWVWRTSCVASGLVSAALGLGLALWFPSLASMSSSKTSGAEGAVQDSADSVNASVDNVSVASPISRPVNVLVMGIDRVPDVKPGSPESFGGRSDVMLLLRLSPEDRSAAVLSVPRDTQVEIPNYGLTKINHANWMGGPALTRRVVSYNFNNVEIDRYVRVNTGAFRAIVDAVGGVRVFVPKPMQYVDQTQGLAIDLAQGWQTLNGDQAEQFARFRNDEYGDIGRVQRQQTLIKALRKRMANPTIVARIPQLLEIFQDYVDTNLTPEEMVALVRFGIKVSPDGLEMVMLPGRASEAGEFNASYWLMDEAKRDQILKNYFEVAPTANLAQGADSWSDVSLERGPYDVRIAVQNASEQEDQANHMVDHLRELGFTDVYVADDWPEANAATEIIVQQGDRDAANLIKRRLGLGAIDSASTGDLESEITVRVGSDWDSPFW